MTKMKMKTWSCPLLDIVILSEKRLEKYHNVPFASVHQTIKTSHILIKTFSLLILSKLREFKNFNTPWNIVIAMFQ
jgi:hypothetical protein